MRRSAILLGTASLVGLVVACGELFDEPQQCAFDRDCEAIAKGSRCDVRQRVCVPGDGTTGSDGGSTPPGPTDAATTLVDAELPPSCDVDPKPLADVPGTIAQTAQGPQIDLTAPLTLDCTKDWKLSARLVVKSGATLTIQAGTKVRMDKAANAGIVVQPGARIVAKGTADRPVVLTSNEAAPAAGDWRGLFLLGSAPPAGGTLDANDPVLGYGGNADADTSGELQFLRVEWSTSGVVMGGVGTGTSIESVHVRRTNDNCFTFFGGRARAKYLVCTLPADEMFEMNAGFEGRLQFVFGTKTPAGANHHGALTDNSFAQIYNATICGDNVANQGTGIVFRNNSRLDFANAIVTGWALGVDTAGAVGTPLEIRSSVISGNTTNPAGPTPDGGFDTLGLVQAGARANRFTPAGLVDCYSPTAPKPWPNAAITGGRTPPNDGFFDTAATYIGAVRDANDGWITAKWLGWQ